MNQNFRNFALWAIIALLLIAVFQLFSNGSQNANAREIPYSQFLSDVDTGRVTSVTIQGQRITGNYGDGGQTFQTYAPDDAQLIPRLEGKNVQITAASNQRGDGACIALASYQTHCHACQAASIGQSSQLWSR